MSRDYDEKRDFFRMAADCPLTLKHDGTAYEGHCINLSAGGIFFRTEQTLPVGSDVEIHISPDKSVVPPLNAIVEVIRGEPSATANQFDYACSIKKLL